jgi:hypothetical protein
MKVGTKMVEAKTVMTRARYIRVSPVARATGQAGIAALYYNVTTNVCALVVVMCLQWGRR